MIIKSIAPAKINLGLKLKGKRSDGYHEIDTIMQSINLFDEIIVKSIPGNQIRIKCSRELNCDYRNNTAYKAAAEFFNYTGIDVKGLEIEIIKKIPICAGLAGGSSDAAAVIVSLNVMLNLGLSYEDLEKIGRQIGADVPFCIFGGAAHAYGTGTNLEKIKGLRNCGILIVKPHCSISTKHAYQLYDECRLNSNNDVSKIIAYIDEENIKDTAKSLFNDFELFVKDDEINKLRKEILQDSPLGICMSGSGPTIFAIFKSLYHSNSCTERLKQKYFETFSCKPIDHGVKILNLVK